MSFNETKMPGASNVAILIFKPNFFTLIAPNINRLKVMICSHIWTRRSPKLHLTCYIDI